MLEINLRPRDFRPPRVKKQISIGARGPIALLVLAVVAMVLFSSAQIAKFSELKSKKLDLEMKQSKMQAELDIIEKIEIATGDLQSKIKIIKKQDQDRTRWIRMMNIVNEALPDGVWLTGMVEKSIVVKVVDQRAAALEAQKGGKAAPRLKSKTTGQAAGQQQKANPGLMITGMTRDPEGISILMNKLKDSGLFQDFEIEKAMPKKLDRWQFLEFNLGCIYSKDKGGA